MKSVMQHAFSQIPSIDIQRSSFNRSHGYKTTFNAGGLIPIFVDEVLPGDTFNLQATLFARLATPVVPFMDNLFLETFFFFVPNRLIWSHWENFNGQQDYPSSTTDYLVPTIAADPTGAVVGSVADYMGIPTGVPVLANSINALPFRAYLKIWNDWFRDENLQSLFNIPVDDGPDPPALTEANPSSPADPGLSFLSGIPLPRGKRHDYFTSCLPWPQKGSSVDIPIGATADINGTLSGTLSVASPTVTIADGRSYYRSLGLASNPVTTPTQSIATVHQTSIENNPSFESAASVSALNGSATISGISGLTADLTSATAVTINSLRQAIAVQQLLELDARGGTRYTEIIRAHFGVVSPDARLQRSEYLGGSSTRININPVQQTSSTDDTTPQGNLAAFGVGADTFHGFTESFTEHGYIIGLVNVRADLTYQQGLSRMWSRQTRYDFYWPALAHLGEQAVLNKEIYMQGTSADNDVFGYQERYAEYRYFPSMITGKFRSTYEQSLDVWHLSQKFSSLPTLSPGFIHDNPPIERVVAVTSEPQFLLDCYFDMNCVRPMPVYGVPGLTRM